MWVVGAVCILVLVVSTLIHFECLSLLNAGLPPLHISGRIKLVLVVLGAFVGHTLEILAFAGATYWLAWQEGLGTIDGSHRPSFATCFYFASTTYTSLGYGDVIAGGPLRLLAGSMSLTGLLLIGWTAAYLYISMERFWEIGKRQRRP